MLHFQRMNPLLSAVFNKMRFNNKLHSEIRYVTGGFDEIKCLISNDIIMGDLHTLLAVTATEAINSCLQLWINQILVICLINY